MKRLLSTYLITGLFGVIASLHTTMSYAQHEVEVWLANEEHEYGTQVLDGDLNFIVGDTTGGIEGSTEHTHMGDFTEDRGTYYSANVGEGDVDTTSVDVIDANTKTIFASVYTAGRSHAVIVSPDDRWAIVNNLNNNTQLIDTTSNAIVNTIPVVGMSEPGTNHRPVCVATSGDSKKIYHAAAVTDRLVVITIDPETGQEAAPQKEILGIENACGLLRSGNNKVLYVVAGKATGGNNAGANQLHVINIKTDEIITSVSTEGDDAHAIAETPDGKELWVGNRDSGEIQIFSARGPNQYQIVETIDLNTQLNPDNDPELAARPDLFGFSPNGKAFYSVMRDPRNTVIKIDVATRTVVREVDTGGEPHGVRVRGLTD